MLDFTGGIAALVIVDLLQGELIGQILAGQTGQLVIDGLSLSLDFSHGGVILALLGAEQDAAAPKQAIVSDIGLHIVGHGLLGRLILTALTKQAVLEGGEVVVAGDQIGIGVGGGGVVHEGVLIKLLAVRLDPLGLLLVGVVGFIDQAGIHIGLPAILAVVGHVFGIQVLQRGGVLLAEGNAQILGLLTAYGIDQGGVHTEVIKAFAHGGAVAHVIGHVKGVAVVGVVVIGHVVLLIGDPIEHLSGGDGGITHGGQHRVLGIGTVGQISNHVLHCLGGQSGLGVSVGGGSGAALDAGRVGRGGTAAAGSQAQGQSQQQGKDAKAFHDILLWLGGLLSDGMLTR